MCEEERQIELEADKASFCTQVYGEWSVKEISYAGRPPLRAPGVSETLCADVAFATSGTCSVCLRLDPNWKGRLGWSIDSHTECAALFVLRKCVTNMDLQWKRRDTHPFMRGIDTWYSFRLLFWKHFTTIVYYNVYVICVCEKNYLYIIYNSKYIFWSLWRHIVFMVVVGVTSGF